MDWNLIVEELESDLVYLDETKSNIEYIQSIIDICTDELKIWDHDLYSQVEGVLMNLVFEMADRTAITTDKLEHAKEMAEAEYKTELAAMNREFERSVK